MNRRSGRSVAAAIAALVGAAAPAAPAAAQSEREAVLAVAQGLFDAMRSRDTTAYGRLVLPEIRYLAIVDVGGPVLARWSDNAQFLEALTAEGPAFHERMWEPEVRISGPLAEIWTPYDFHFGEEFSHCGVDAFHLVKTGGEWRIAQISYTVVRPRTRCTPGPSNDQGVDR